jgi:hypothetical protein
VLWGIALDEALAFAALGVQCRVFECTHQEFLTIACEPLSPRA